MSTTNTFEGVEFFGMSYYEKYFLESESMDRQLSNALSIMFLRHLVMFLHFYTYAFANPQKGGFSGKSGVELDFLPHIYNLSYKS